MQPETNRNKLNGRSLSSCRLLLLVIAARR